MNANQKKNFFKFKKKKVLQCNVLSKQQGKVFNKAIYPGEMSTSPGCSVVKNLPANARDSGLIPRLGRIPLGRKWRECVLIRICRRHSGNACEKIAYFWTHNYQFQFRKYLKKITRQFVNLAK